MTTKPEATSSGQGRNRIPPWIVLPLLGLWMLLSGKLDAFHLGVGVAVVAFFFWRANVLLALEACGAPRLRLLRLIPYSFWLFWQMILSAVYVARVVLHPRRHLDPRLVTFHTAQPSLLSGVTLANSITLTPGTLTVDLHENRFVVHALSAKTAGDVLDGDMARRVARLFTDQPLPALKVISGPNAKAAT